MDKPEKIVVYTVCDSVIDANIAKTKLDAYGIPCFLENEHLANLYPLQGNPYFGVRLMIFEKDHGRVKEILEEESEENSSVCPFCRSKNIYAATSGGIPTGFISLLEFAFGLASGPKHFFVCRDCEKEFETPDNF